jgi:hypothetical protein
MKIEPGKFYQCSYSKNECYYILNIGKKYIKMIALVKQKGRTSVEAYNDGLKPYFENSVKEISKDKINKRFGQDLLASKAILDILLEAAK